LTFPHSFALLDAQDNVHEISIAQDVAQSKKPEPLYNLKASERRVIHMALADHPDVVTESVGEGFERHLLIKPR